MADEPETITTPESVTDVAATETAADPVPPKAEDSEVARLKKAVDRQQQRIDELTFQRHERERQAAKPEPVKQEAVEKPTLEQFAFDDAKYNKALADWQDAEIDRKVTERFEKREQEQRVKTREQSFRERERNFAEKNPGYREKVYESGTTPISNAMAEELMDSDFGPQIIDYLADHKDIAAQLYELPVRQVAREIGRLEAKFSAAKETPTSNALTPPVKKVSQAPPPAPKIEASEPSVRVAPDDPESDKMSDAEWRRARDKQAARRKAV